MILKKGTKCFFSLLLVCLLSTMGCDMNSENRLNDWLGSYEYYEFTEPNINFSIEVDVFLEDSKYYAEIEILGFQIWQTMTANVVGNENKIEFRFMEETSSGYPIKLQKGEVLFTFKKSGDKIITDWGAVEPYTIENQNDGEERFEKIVDAVSFKRRDTNEPNVAILMLR